MILISSIALGLLLRRLGGHELRSLSDLRLRGEGLLLLLLAAQSLAPLLRLDAVATRVAFVAWLLTFPALIAVCLVNRKMKGMALLGTGLLLNLLVILANGGMPVAAAAVEQVRGALAGVAIPATDFVHVPMTAATALPWLADVVPVPGPPLVRSIVSPGDILLFAGIVTFIARATSAPAKWRDSEPLQR